MKQEMKVKLAMRTVIVKRTKNPNARCLKCNKAFYSWSRSLAYEGVICRACGGRDEWD